jgi:flagellar assembly factor FliW
MPVKFQSLRFGAVEAPEEDLLEFPFGLVGLDGNRYAIIEHGGGFYWLHSVEDPALALPIVRPALYFPDFALQINPMDRERVGFTEAEVSDLYVTVRAAPNPLETTANLRAPIVIHDGKGYQVLNDHDPAPLQAPLFELAEQPGKQPVHSADAA